MRYLYLIVSVIGIFLSACTRPLGDKPSSMTIALPKEMMLKTGNATQATLAFLGHVVINVRGPGISVPISVNFEADKHDGGTPTSLPASFTLDVPAGSGRLIQIVAVYLDPTTKMGDFYYGDVTQDLITGDNNIMIPVNLVGSGSVEGGRISGRYYLADGSTPSGIMEARYQPLGGRPAVVIERSSILNGWFSSFALDSVPLDIVLAPSEVKLFTALKLSNFDATTFTDNKKMKIILPNRYQSYGASGGDNKRAETSVIGFFGDGVPSVAKVCYTEASRAYTQIFTDSNKTTPIQWSVDSTNPADMRAIKSSAVVACVATDISAAYTTVIPFRPVLLNSWSGSEAIPGFIGIFQFPSDVTNGSSPVQVSYGSAGQYNVRFSVLPGTSGVADSVGVFYRASNSPRDYYGNGGAVPCQQIAQGGLGFTKISSIPLVAGTLDYNGNYSSPADISNNAVMAFCPIKGGIAMGGGFVTDHLNNNSGSMPMAANSFNASAELSVVGTGQCHRIRLSLVNESNGNISYNVANSAIRSLTFSDNATNMSYFADENACISGAPTTNSVSINSNSFNGEVWFKNTSVENRQITFASTSFSATPVYRSVNVSFQTPGGATRLKVLNGSLKMGPNECRIVDVYTTNGVDIPSPHTVTINLFKLNLSMSSVTDTSFDFYADCASTTPISSIVFAGDFKKTFAVKSGGSPSNDRIIQMTGLSTFNLYYNIQPHADHLAIKINNGNPVYKGSCVPLYIEAQDINNAKVSSATFDFGLNVYHPTIQEGFGNFKFGCAGAAPGPFTLATGSYSSLSFSPTIAQTGLRMETQSIFQGKMNPIAFDIRPAPPVERPITLKVHLMSDDLTPISTPTAISGWPVLDSTISTSNPANFVSVDVSNNPKRDGALFINTSSYISGPIFGVANVSDDVMMTVKFKMDSLSNADILSLGTDTAGTFKIYVDNFTAGTYKIKGSGGWIGPDIAVNTWYTVSLTKDVVGNTYGYINGANSGPGAAGNPGGTNFTNFRIGSGFQGAVKAVVIDIGGSVYSSFDVPGEHQYINSRVSDN